MAVQRLIDKFVLAERWGVSPRTIEKWTQERTIPFVRLSRRCVRYDLDEVARVVTERRVPAGGADR